MAKAEKFLVEGFSMDKIIKEDFLKKLKEINKSIFPVSLVFISEKESGEMKSASPVVFSHQNKEEVNNERLHIESPDTELVDSIVKWIDKKKNGNR